MQRWSATTSGKEGRGAGGRKECRREGGVQGSEEEADRRGKVNKVHKGP